MKIFLNISLAILCSLLFACSTTTTKNSIDMAASGKTKLVYSGLTSDNAALHKAVLSALQLRGWTITDSGNPIKAKISNRGQNAVVSIEASGGKLEVDTKGSTIDDGTAYVPIRYVDYLHKTVVKQLSSAN